MKIQNFSVLIGSKACNARCPYCISKMTPSQGMKLKKDKVNWRNFHIASRIAEKAGVMTVMLTGKGEPTLFPEEISMALDKLQVYNFPIIEIQTNAIVFSTEKERYKKYLQEWYDKGLTTISISVVHYEDKKNIELLYPNIKSVDLKKVIKMLRDIGYSIRLSIIMVKNYIDNIEDVDKFISFCKENNVTQLTMRPVTLSRSKDNPEVFEWTKKNKPNKKDVNKIYSYVRKKGNLLMNLMHGASIYDIKGISVCITTCLTLNPNMEDIRQLIFFPNGKIRYDWQYEGAILL